MHFWAQKHGQTLCLGPCFWLASLGRRVHLSVVCLLTADCFCLLTCTAAASTFALPKCQQATANCLLSYCLPFAAPAPAHAPSSFSCPRTRAQTIYVDAYWDTERPLGHTQLEPIHHLPRPLCCPLKSSMYALLFRKKNKTEKENRAEWGKKKEIVVGQTLPFSFLIFRGFHRRTQSAMSRPLLAQCQGKVGLWVAVTCS